MNSPALSLAPKIVYREDAKISKREDRELRRLLSESFPLRPSFHWRRHLGITPPHRWLLFSEEGEIAAHAAVFDRQFWTENGLLSVGGVAQVCVKPTFRGNGLTRLILGEIHCWLRENSTPFSVLFGNPSVYRSSGYSEASNPILATNSLGKRWNPFRGKLMVRALSNDSWPSGVINLNGPSF